MSEERRANSLEVVLVSLGRLEESNKNIKDTVVSLDGRVAIQNGKVSKIERWQSFIQGSLAILILMVVPILINFVSSWIQYEMQK